VSKFFSCVGFICSDIVGPNQIYIHTKVSCKVSGSNFTQKRRNTRRKQDNRINQRGEFFSMKTNKNTWIASCVEKMVSVGGSLGSSGGSKGSSRGSLVATSHCETAVLGLNPAISPAYNGLPVPRWAAIWDGTLLLTVLWGSAEENINNRDCCSTANN
jgi:hypothetical protein